MVAGSGVTKAAGAEPHRPLTRWYGAPAERAGFVRALFNGTAADYDRINGVFSLGTGGWYRRQALRRAGLAPGQRVLDVAVGTGLVAAEAVRVLGDPGAVTGLDLSEGMLAEARRRLPGGARLVQARAEALPVADGSVDFLSMGYALRHVSDLGVAFAEYQRVLRPGGRVLLLEIGRPEGPAARTLLKAYLGRVVPALCRWTAPRRRAGQLMDYYWDTIEACVPADTILRHLRGAGFTEVRCDTSLGVFKAYSGRRPPEAT
ncbi:bifunctional demethylmenaquinone methyltransferase/2-methoxy-6-polyprenyl-1,4-benzoquinol methylase UbiE [Craurococcus roseus]|uniref:Ubiquinone/menaquinone biosynthesis C-methyltransferase UbiE n=1 Tax=Craurococcus roseus TaxID=77585 RepID=A0ABN1FA86_9PROT